MKLRLNDNDGQGISPEWPKVKFRLNRLSLLLDFVNVKKWDTEALLDFFAGHSVINWLNRARKSLESQPVTKFVTSSLPYYIFWLEENEHALEMAAATDLAILPGDPRYEVFFDYILSLRAQWIDRIKKTITDGPDIPFLNSIARHTRVIFFEGPTPWAPAIGNYLDDLSTFEAYLEADYLEIFLGGQGDLFKRLRICRDPACSKWFIYHRPKQISCSDKCRLAFHALEKAKDEAGKKARAEKVRQGRRAGLYQ
jgi:hypothetical protein